MVNRRKFSVFSSFSVNIRSWIYFSLLVFVIGNVYAQERHPSPVLSLYDNQDQLVDLKNYRGQVVMVSFWATWCPPCIEEFPSQQKLKETYKNHNFEVLAVNMGQAKSDIEGFLFSLDTSANFPILLDTNSQAAKDWKIRALPTTILIDKLGNQVLREVGPRNWNSEENQAKVAALLSE
ncbi:MAG: redoxin family protein [Gammaproteobacteria bacterium]|nr:redoxin family protein [Gammaproteobacteria bacterium]